MKTKLRKEFEDHLKSTERRLWILENPPKFTFDERVEIYCDERGKNGKPLYGIYKGQSTIKTGYYGYLYRECFIEDEEERRLILVDERQVLKVK